VVEAPEVNAKLKGAILFPDEEYQSSTQGVGRTNKLCSEVLVNELTESHKFLLGQGVDGTEGWGSAFIQGDLEIVRSMVSKFTSLGFAEHVLEVMIVFRNSAHIDWKTRSGHRMTTGLGMRDMKLETLGAFELACTGVSSCIDKGNSW